MSDCKNNEYSMKCKQSEYYALMHLMLNNHNLVTLINVYPHFACKNLPFDQTMVYHFY